MSDGAMIAVTLRPLTEGFYIHKVKSLEKWSFAILSAPSPQAKGTVEKAQIRVHQRAGAVFPEN